MHESEKNRPKIEQSPCDCPGIVVLPYISAAQEEIINKKSSRISFHPIATIF